MRRRVLGDALDLRRGHNSLNFLRLVLALSVLVSHAIGFGLYAYEGIFNGTTLGTVAVYGFFGISGYLIAGSALQNDFGRYLWQRCLRILPGYWVCLIVTAFGFGAVDWLTMHAQGLTQYAHVSDGPFQYLLRNLALQIYQPTIARVTWNGSLWTLFYEFCCYLVLGGLAIVGVLRKPMLVAVLAGAVWFTCSILTLAPGMPLHFNLFENWMWMNLLKFGAIFLVGAALYVLRDRVPDSGWLALGCATLFTASLWLPTDRLLPAFAFTKSDLLAPLLGYPLLWLGAHLPFQRIGAKNDYSYGVYIYAYPVQVLLLEWGVTRWGYLPYVALTLVMLAPFAAASWWLVEKRALQLKAFDPHIAWRRSAGRFNLSRLPGRIERGGGRGSTRDDGPPRAVGRNVE